MTPNLTAFTGVDSQNLPDVMVSVQFILAIGVLFSIWALCQILLMLVKKSYICLMKALNRTRLFSAFFEANDVLL
ncbi:hypothetical protein LOB78_10130 [Lactobacillus delbrueckii subsp. lactis]|uniref:hypothetical protein n=1 Tax=Lactobacillus delbrueckii TaxID=1584 RepID=UPI001E4CCEDF|nr:hypothetical protein [Lactobacillus delbrueckii]MCD5445026.1 hypothetical protein [Lactobacillus delbrueckii subsp. lactis]MCD5513074.1 hypothetical protein [Lactobacillus delbrueckii subsp. lactis]